MLKEYQQTFDNSINFFFTNQVLQKNRSVIRILKSTDLLSYCLSLIFLHIISNIKYLNSLIINK